MGQYLTDEQALIAKKAQAEWDDYEVQDKPSPYEVAKGIEHLPGVKNVFLDEHTSLSIFNLSGVHGLCTVVPLQTADGNFSALQALLPHKVKRKDKNGKEDESNKLFPAGAAASRSFHLIGEINPEGAVYLVEGYATGATIRMAMPSWTVVVAMFAHNLPKVAKDLRQLYPKLSIHICADNDLWSRGNAGQKYAKGASQLTGGRIFYPYFPKLPTDGKGVTTDFNDMHRLGGIDAVKKRLTSDKAHLPQELLFQFETLPQFIDKKPPEHRWLIDKLLVEGGTSTLVAPAKTGKSTIARQIAYSIATGSPFLGLKTKKSDVLYFALDEPRYLIHTGWSRLTDEGEQRPENILIYPKDRRLPEDRIRRLETYCRAYRPGIIFIDTLMKFCALEGDSQGAEVTKALNPLIDIAARTGTHICFLYHMNKSARNKEVVDITANDIRGSGAFFELVDVAIMCGKTASGKRWISTEGRTGWDFPKTWLTYDPVLMRVGKGNELADEVDEDGEEEKASNRKKVLEYFEGLSVDRWIQMKDLKENVKVRNGKHKPLIIELVKEKLIRCRKAAEGVERKGTWLYARGQHQKGQLKIGDEY